LERKVVRRKGKDGKIYEQTYYYAWHYLKGPDGKRQIKKCYLGPEQYVHSKVTQGREGIQVKGLIQEVLEGRLLIIDYVNDIAKSVEDKMAKGQVSAYTAQQLADRLQELVTKLREYAQQRAVKEEKAKAKGGKQ
jgi:hypothetical protein